MEEGSKELECMEIKHRKEKKELQSQIQALKKTIKGDKTKKKDVASEIIRLENELESRQKQELEVMKNVQSNDENLVEPHNLVNDFPKLKVSKAQKRRDKKSQQEKERELQIKLQEKENINGPRNTEMLAIKEKLKKRQLKIFPVLSDGDCLYKAISHQLEVTKQICISVDELRIKVSNYIEGHKEDFLPFMSNPDTSEILNDAEFKKYCENISTTKMWGSQLEVKALSNALKFPIQIIQASGPSSINQGDEFNNPPLVITYHRHMYKLGEHYNSTEVLDDEEDE